MLQPVYGPALVPGAEAAIAAGIAIGNIDQILGADNTTADSQVEGQLVNVVFVPSELGRKIGEIVVTRLRRCQPMQRRLHLVGQGRGAGRHAEGGVRRGDVRQSEHQGRR